MRIASLLVTALLLASASGTGGQAPAGIAANRAPLAPGAFVPLPLGAVTPTGWLRRQLEIQAAGLTGHLDEFWPDVGPSSGWLGGDGESWERGPYFLDGLLPLAHLLNDQRLLAKVKPWIEWTLTHQAPSGWIGPTRNQDWWPNFVMLKVLIQHHEATGDPRVVPVMQRYFAHMAATLPERPMKDWAVYRWGDQLVSVLWLYNRTGDPALLDLARTLRAKGADWKAHFANFPFPEKTTAEQLGAKPGTGVFTSRMMFAHGVNNGMALKTSTLWSLVSGEASDREAIRQALAVLDRYHGLPNGMFSADEHYAGRDPAQGIELCAVVEAMYSLQQAIAVTGDAALADRLERISFNALPATISPDMWSHQYDQQPNQVLCTVRKRAWTTNGPESNVFGLEPNFGCCTANMHQGWPKLVGSLWMATPDDGLAAVVYAPSLVRTVVAGGVPVTIAETTDYPFRGDVRLAVRPARPTRFPLRLRIPAWAAGSTVTVNGQDVAGAVPGAFVTVHRQWTTGDVVRLRFPAAPRLSRWHRGSVAIERGPLVMALGIGEEWRKIGEGMRRPAKAPAADWEVLPRTAWNYALAVDEASVGRLAVEERPVGAVPFRTGAAPVTITVNGRRVPDWTLVEGSAGPVPEGPAVTREPEETLRLVPYGSTRLRVTAFPTLARP